MLTAFAEFIGGDFCIVIISSGSVHDKEIKASPSVISP